MIRCLLKGLPRQVGIACACLLLLLLPATPSARAQPPVPRLRMSLLTCGVGDEIYASFGHAGLRIVDSAAGTDIVYNYGTFNGFEENFELKFMRGKLLYYLAEERFQDFLPVYISQGRSVWEQELLLTPAQKAAVRSFLEENLLPQNRAYKYDFIYDNCATRLRDILPRAVGPAYQPGAVLLFGGCITFRQTIDKYLAAMHWERYGINLLLGAPIDRCMDDKNAQFLPDYLRESLAGATIGGQPAAAAPVLLLPARGAPAKPGPNGPLLLNGALLLLTGIAWSLRRARPVAIGITRVLLTATGLLGCLILVMWFGTDHEACRPNWNLLWALPTNLVAAALPLRRLRGYAAFAIVLLLAALGVHLAGVQALPLGEAWPLLLALAWCYGMIYRAFRR